MKCRLRDANSSTRFGEQTILFLLILRLPLWTRYGVNKIQRRNVDGGTEEKRSSCRFATSFAASSCRCFRFPQQEQRLRERPRELNEHPMPRTKIPTPLSNCECGMCGNLFYPLTKNFKMEKIFVTPPPKFAKSPFNHLQFIKTYRY